MISVETKLDGGALKGFNLVLGNNSGGQTGVLSLFNTL